MIAEPALVTPRAAFPGGDNDYRAILHSTDGTSPLIAVRDQFNSWLREKKIDVDLSRDADYVWEATSLKVRYHEQQRGTDFLASLSENTPRGTWNTSVLATADGWVDLSVRSDEGHFVAVPRLARYLLDAAHLGAAATELSSNPIVVDPTRVPELIEVLVSPDRTFPIFVAGLGEDTTSFNALFMSEFKKWAGQTYGLAQSFILTPAARELFSASVGAFGASPWVIRTYFSGVTLADPRDALDTAT